MSRRKPSKRMFDKIATGGTIRKFNGKRYEQSGSYRTKSSAQKAATYARSMSGSARIIKYKKGYVVFTNYSKTKGKLVPRRSKR